MTSPLLHAGGDGHLGDAVEVIWPGLVKVLTPRLTRQRLRRAIENGRVPRTKETFAELCVRQGVRIWGRTPWDKRVQPGPWSMVDEFLDELSRLDAALERADQGMITQVSEHLRDWAEVLAQMAPPRRRGRPWEERRWTVAVEYARVMGLLDARLQYVPRRARRLAWADLVDWMRRDGLEPPAATSEAVRKGVLRFLRRQHRVVPGRRSAATS